MEKRDLDKGSCCSLFVPSDIGSTRAIGVHTFFDAGLALAEVALPVLANLALALTAAVAAAT